MQVAEHKPNVSVGVRGVEPANVDECFRLAGAIHQSGLAPYGLDSPQKVLVALLTGMGLGFGAMASLHAIHVIEGSPSISAKAAKALILGSGIADAPIEASYSGQGLQRACTVATVRNGKVVAGEFSMKDAQTAGLLNRKNWKTYPDRMLRARATANLANDHFADLMLGVGISEEVEDIPKRAPRPVVEEIQPGLDPLLIQDEVVPKGGGAIAANPETGELLKIETVQDETGNDETEASVDPVDVPNNADWIARVEELCEDKNLRKTQISAMVKKHSQAGTLAKATIPELKKMAEGLESL